MPILTEEMQRVVREQRLGYVATVCPDGTPNLSPKGCTFVWDEDHLVFGDIRSPGTMENLRRNPAVEINVVDPIARKGYRFKGTATVIAEGSRFEDMLSFFRDQGVRSRVRSAALVRVERALPLTSPAYDLGQTEEEIRRRWMAHVRALDRARGGSPGR
jgi:predicted pyridoxine 5'-phosphate oxidase superfamily flavin-nucleotide-binding protein